MNKHFGLLWVTFESDRVITKDYGIVFDWIFNISFSLILFGIWSFSEYFFIKNSFAEPEWIFLVAIWMMVGWFLFRVLLFPSTFKRCPKYEFSIDILNVFSLNPQISVVWVVRHNWSTTIVEYWVNIFTNWHKKIPLRAIGFSYEPSALSYAQAVSDYYKIPLKTNLDRTKRHYKLVYIFCFILFLPLLFVWINLAYQHFMK